LKSRSHCRFSAPTLLVAVVMVLSLPLWGAGCGSSDELRNVGAEARFEHGKKLFDDGDYLEAIAEFEIVKLQFPGSAVADQAQFYIGEAHFNKGEYLLAIEEYRTLKRNMASSPLVPTAQYKIALSYYNLAPRPELDQTYTRQAIDEFQAFVEYYPLDDHRKEAEEKIRELNGRLAKKLFDIAEQYMKLGYFRSAGVYFDYVIQQYHDSPYAEPAAVGKIRSLVNRNRWKEAGDEIAKFFERYPESQYRSEVEGLNAQLPVPPASGASAGQGPGW
jgi:outer membrane protein assembly factor BamD